MFSLSDSHFFKIHCFQNKVKHINSEVNGTTFNPLYDQKNNEKYIFLWMERQFGSKIFLVYFTSV